jgi:hypothetical protein
MIIREKLAGITHIAYTSYSHRPGNERWRALIPYREPVGVERHRAVHEHFQALFNNDLDERCAVAAQVWYTPACPRDAGGEFRCFHELGTLFDPMRVALPDDTPKAEPPVQPIPVTRHLAATLKRLESALEHLDHDDREVWVKVGLAIKHDLGDAGRQAWLDWSAKSPAKFDRDHAIKTWESFKIREPGDEPAITLGSVYMASKRDGGIRSGRPHRGVNEGAPWRHRAAGGDLSRGRSGLRPPGAASDEEADFAPTAGKQISSGTGPAWRAKANASRHGMARASGLT